MSLLSTKTIQVDFQNPGAQQIVYVVQEDNLSRQIAFHIFSGGAEWIIPDGTLVTVRYYKPDGTFGHYDTLPDGESAYSVDKNIVLVTLAPQMLVISGDVQMQLNLYDGTGSSIATFSTVVRVSKNIVPSDVVESSTYFNLLTNKISTAVSSANEAKTYAESAEQSAGQASSVLENALLKTGGTMTGPLTLLGGMTPQNLGTFSDMQTSGWNAIKAWYGTIQDETIGFSVINNTEGVVHGLSGGRAFLVAYKTNEQYGVIAAYQYATPYQRFSAILSGSFSDFT